MGLARKRSPRPRRRIYAPVVSALFALATALGTASGPSAASISLPGEFIGDVHILLDAHAWGTRDDGHWSGFSVRTTAELTFDRGSSGLWTLIRATPSAGRAGQPLGGFLILQIISASNFGVCSARYKFEIQYATGDIGSFSESGNVYSATMDLGLHAKATVTGINCGPNLESTTHPFGGNQRVTIPIQSSGAFSRNELSFRSRSTSPFAGGSLVATIDGSLYGQHYL